MPIRFATGQPIAMPLEASLAKMVRSTKKSIQFVKMSSLWMLRLTQCGSWLTRTGTGRTKFWFHFRLKFRRVRIVLGSFPHVVLIARKLTNR
eukprot:UN04366